MSSRGFDFEAVIWDCRFSEGMKSILSQSKHRAKGTFFGMFDSAKIQRSAAVHISGITVSEAHFSFFTLRHKDFSQYKCRQHTTTEKARGAIESRYYIVAPIPADMKSFRRSWKGLKTIGQAITTTMTSDGTLR